MSEKKLAENKNLNLFKFKIHRKGLTGGGKALCIGIVNFLMYYATYLIDILFIELLLFNFIHSFFIFHQWQWASWGQQVPLSILV